MVQYPILGSWRTSHWHGIFKGSGAEKAMEPLWDPSLAPKKAHPFQQFSSRHEESAFLRGNFDGNWETVFTVFFFLRMLFLQRRSGRHTETSMSTARFFLGGKSQPKTNPRFSSDLREKQLQKLSIAMVARKVPPQKKNLPTGNLSFFSQRSSRKIYQKFKSGCFWEGWVRHSLKWGVPQIDNHLSWGILGFHGFIMGNPRIFNGCFLEVPRKYQDKPLFIQSMYGHCRKP